MKEKKMLLIVDPQNDFINGTLPVPRAAEAMNQLAEYVTLHDGEYALKVVTSDWHPYTHCSYSGNGGQWPVHCVAHTVGAAIWPPLIEPLYTTAGEVEILRKGTCVERDEYSVFSNDESAKRFSELMDAYNITHVDICGLAGDICVLNTLMDGVALYGKGVFHVLTSFSPSLDGGVALGEYLKTID